MKRFKRSAHAGARKNLTDVRGTVQVLVRLQYGSPNQKGSLSRSLSLKDAKVSEVFKAIENTLVSTTT